MPFSTDINIVPYGTTVKYLGMTFDNKFRWKEHIEKKREFYAEGRRQLIVLACGKKFSIVSIQPE